MNIKRSNCYRNAFSLFKSSESGMASVEAAGYFIVFFMLCAFLSDWSVYFLDKSRVERINSSLSAVLRERTVLYGGNEEIDQINTDTLFSLAGKLMEGGRIANRDYSIVIDAVYFTQGTASPLQTFQNGKGTCQVQRPGRSDIVKLAAWDTDAKRWRPVYQVTLCVAGTNSWFTKLKGIISSTAGDLSISNVVVPR